jgi:hypothetical protein
LPARVCAAFSRGRVTLLGSCACEHDTPNKRV